MTKVTGSLWDVSKAATRATEVRVHAKEARTSGDGLITTEQARVDINAGRVTFDCEPGWALMWIMGGGRVHEEIPLFVSGEAASLAECVQMGADMGEYAPETLANFVAEVRQSLSDAEGVLGRVSGQAKAAESSAAAAAGSESRAKTHADTAEGHAGTAKDHADTAKGHVDTARTHAESASRSATDAGTYHNAAKNYAVTAIGQADKATAAADRVATIAGSTRWVGTKVEVNGKLSPELMPKITISSKGTWVVNGSDTGLRAQGEPGKDGSTRFEDLTPEQRESLVGARGPAGVVASATDPGKDVVWLDTAGQVGGLSEPIALVASGTGWQYATKPGGSSRYVVDYRGWAVLTVMATGCDEVRLYDFSQATNPFAIAVPPAGNFRDAVMSTQMVVNCTPRGPAVRVLNPTAETKILLSVEPLEARGQVVWVPDGKGGRESFTALAGPPGQPGPPGPAGTTAWSGITGKPATYPTTWSEVLGKPSTFPAAAHRHSWQEIDGKPEKYPAEKHTHPAADVHVLDGRTVTDVQQVFQGLRDGKADAQHRHTWSEIDGKPDLASATHTHDVADIQGTSNDIGKGHHNKVVRSGGDGKIFTYTPVSEVTNDKELVAKGYVDAQVKEVADQVERRPAFFWGFGPPPTEIPDAVVGDVYCNLSTGELHEITGV